MLDALSDIVKNVAIIILLTTFLDMLLPNNSMQRFCQGGDGVICNGSHSHSHFKFI